MAGYGEHASADCEEAIKSEEDYNDLAPKLNGLSTDEHVPLENETSSPKKAKGVSFTTPIDDENSKQQTTRDVSVNNDQDAADFDDDAGGMSAPMGMGMARKKKKSKRPKSKRGLNAPSGFEEYYVDAPLTPAEYQEEKQIYDPSYRFTQRIETAVQRFTAKRRLDSDRKLLFDRYLVHGGIEGGPKMFGGLDANALKSMNAAEIAEMSATHYVDSEKLDAFDASHVVDFEGCLKSFLSGPLINRWELTSKDKVKSLVGIIRNFLNYLLHHDVCPEYKDQIDAARLICDHAVEEIWSTTEVMPMLPGDFNLACSEIFGGMYQGVFSASQAWREDPEMGGGLGISPEHARNVFKIGIAAHASDEMFPIYQQQLKEKSCRLVRTEAVGIEVIEKLPPAKNILDFYKDSQAAGLKVLGKMKAKTWTSPQSMDEDLTEEEEAYIEVNPPETKQYEFLLEDEILQKCEIGMKLRVTLRETSFGLTYFDAVHAVHCSFYQLIPNELMEDWREIEKEWLPMKRNKYLEASREDQGQDNDVHLGEGEDAPKDDSEPASGKERSRELAQENEKKAYLDSMITVEKVDTDLVAAGYDEEDEGDPKGSESQAVEEEKSSSAEPQGQLEETIPSSQNEAKS